MSRRATQPDPLAGAAPRRMWLARFVLLVVFVVGLMAAAWLLPAGRWLQDLLAWVGELGFWAPGIYAALYAAAIVAMVPGSLLSVAGGLLFGLGQGIVIVSLASTAGASATFWIGRTLGRGFVARKLAGRPQVQALDEAVARRGLLVVLLTRLSPMFPFVVLNYGYGLTGVRFWRYALASWLGMLPGTVVYVYVGTLLGDLAMAASDGREHTTVEWAFLAAGLVAAVVTAVVLARIAQKTLRKRAPAAATGKEKQT